MRTLLRTRRGDVSSTGAHLGSHQTPNPNVHCGRCSLRSPSPRWKTRSSSVPSVDGAERHLRNGLPRLLVRISAETQSASRAGRADGRPHDEEGELGARCRHPRVLRHPRPRMAGPLRRAPDRGPARRAAHPEMAERRRAGGWDSGHRSEVGTPQGGSISPLLANVYLHYVFDLWVQRWRRRQARGDVVVVRFADDFVLGFEYRDGCRTLPRRAARALRASSAWTCIPTKRVSSNSAATRPNRRARGTGSRRPSTSWASRTCCGKTRKGRLHGAATDDAEADAGEAEGGQSRPPATHARPLPGDRRVAARRRSRASAVTSACR